MTFDHKNMKLLEKYFQRIHYLRSMSVHFLKKGIRYVSKIPRRLKINRLQTKPTLSVSPKTGVSFEYSLRKQIMFNTRLIDSVSIFVPGRVNNSQFNIENDLRVNFERCMDGLSIHHSHFWPKSDLVHREIFQPQLVEELSNFIKVNRPQILFLDANMQTGQKTFNNKLLSNLREKYKFKTIFFVPDFKMRNINYWSSVADLFVCTLPAYKNRMQGLSDDKLLFLPFLPINSQYFSKFHKDKEIDFFFCGSGNKERKLFLKKLSNLDFASEILFHNRSSLDSLPYEKYLERLAIARSTFSNGYESPKLNFISARFCEAVLMKTVCIYEQCPNLEKFFSPGIHYLSVRSAHDVRYHVQEIIREPERYEVLAEKTLEFAELHYHYRSAYSAMFARVLNSQ